MKKILLAIATCLSLSVFSQNTFQLLRLDDNTAVNANDTLYISVSASANVKFNIDIKNISGTSQTYNVKRYDVLLNNEAIAYFCFGGLCFGETTYEGVNPLTLNSMQSASGVSGQYNILTADLDEGSVAGVSKVKYTFFNTANANDTMQFTAKYNSPQVTTGLKEVKSRSSFEVFPNPATNYAGLRIYAAKQEAGTISVYNALGKVMIQQEINLAEGKNQLEIPTQGLGSGLYFINLSTEGLNTSKRLIIK